MAVPEVLHPALRPPCPTTLVPHPRRGLAPPRRWPSACTALTGGVSPLSGPMRVVADHQALGAGHHTPVTALGIEGGLPSAHAALASKARRAKRDELSAISPAAAASTASTPPPGRRPGPSWWIFSVGAAGAAPGVRSRMVCPHRRPGCRRRAATVGAEVGVGVDDRPLCRAQRLRGAKRYPVAAHVLGHRLGRRNRGGGSGVGVTAGSPPWWRRWSLPSGSKASCVDAR